MFPYGGANTSSYVALTVAGGFLLAYLSRELFSKKHQLNSNGLDSKRVENLSKLIDKIFPFNFIPFDPNDKEVQMNINDENSLKQLIELLFDYNLTKEAINSEMLIHRIYRVLKEQINKSEKHIHTCLWILLHCLLLNTRETIPIILSIFSIEDFLTYFQEKEFNKMKAKHILLESSINDSKGINTIPNNDIYMTEALQYSTEIVWLAYAILGQMFCYYLTKSDLKEIDETFQQKLKGKVVTNFPKNYLMILESNKGMFEGLTFSSYKDNSSTNDDKRYESRIIHNLEHFLSISRKLLMSDDSSLVQLSLAVFGQLFTNVKDIIFIYLLENRTLHITSIIEHVLLCVDENVVLVLGKCIFTLMIRSIDFTVNVVLNNVNILNEIIQWSIGGQQHTTRIQYLNILYLLILQSEKFSLQLILNEKINILKYIYQLFKSEEEIDSQFMALQLYYGLSVHTKAHSYLIEYSFQSTTLISFLKKLTFSPKLLNRYYCLLIWSNLLSNKQYTRFLLRNEQILNLLMFSFKEESDLALKKSITQIIKDICSSPTNENERTILLHHFNLLFEVIDTLHFQLNYLKDVYEIRGGIKNLHNEEEWNVVEQSVQLSFSLVLLLLTIADHDQDSKDMLIHQYQIHRYINDFIWILDQRNDTKQKKIITTMVDSILPTTPRISHK
ncbi:hypothetical protein ABK040_014365 [Willaertia magna]